MSVEEAAARISDFSQPFDVSLFEQIVDAAYEPSNPQQQSASRILVQLQEHPGSNLNFLSLLLVNTCVIFLH